MGLVEMADHDQNDGRLAQMVATLLVIRGGATPRTPGQGHERRPEDQRIPWLCATAMASVREPTPSFLKTFRT